MSTVIRGRIPEHATLRYQEESVDDVQIPYDITFKLVGYESVQIEKQIKAIREAIKKKKTTKFWTLSKTLMAPPPPRLVWTQKVWTLRPGADRPSPPYRSLDILMLKV